MRLFECQSCAQLLYFENTQCERCGRLLGFMPDGGTLSALDPAGGLDWRPLAAPDETRRFCANTAHGACNWLLAPDAADPFCLACRHNRTVPDLSFDSNLAAWRKLEIAKRRLFYTFLKLGLPLRTRAEDPAHGLAFDFLAEQPGTGAAKVMTGHDEGLITLALAEADDAEREKRRTEMGEPYRTLLGHLRHESGHHFWDVMVRDGGFLHACRALFGDDTQDYGAALQAHYANGAPADWQNRFVSAYATAHPWEDFAETWAHYLHIVDAVEMANAFGMSLRPGIDRAGELETDIDFDVYRIPAFQDVVDRWLPLTSALNSLNRCMGKSDLYPFILLPPVMEKLEFVHRLVRRTL